MKATKKKKKINYLSNKELLSEIHKSKNTFCSFIDDSVSDYDLIVKLGETFSEEDLMQAAENRAYRITTQMKNQLRFEGASQQEISAAGITVDDVDFDTLVIRHMTYEHIPINEERTRKIVRESDKYMKVPFPPFKHYKIKDGKQIEVGRSHWEGSIGNGHFSVTHGSVTNQLVRQYMMLVERYSKKGNWRGYTYLDDMKSQALVQLADSGLKFNEAISDNPFAYFTMIATNSFRAVLNAEERVGDIKTKIMSDKGYNESFTRQIDREFD